MANDINIPFKVDDRGYSNEQMKAKDAVTLETLQRIANALENIDGQLKNIQVNSNGGK